MTLNKTENEQIWEIIEPIKVAMLVTEDNGTLRARPMELVQDDFKGELYFYSNKEDEKIDEIISNPRICLTFEDRRNNEYVSISSLAIIESSPDLVDKYWSPSVSAWFPGGRDTACMIVVDCKQAEIWDSTTSKMKILYQVAIANMTNSKPKLGENVKLGR
jgi:general stress protein 26